MAHIRVESQVLTDDNVTTYVDAGLTALSDLVNGQVLPESLCRNRRYYNQMGYQVLHVTPGFSAMRLPHVGSERIVERLGYISFRRNIPPIQQ